MQKNKINRTVRKLVAVGLVFTIGTGNANLWATAQSNPYARLAGYDLTATWRDRTQQAHHEPDEGRDAIRGSIYSREDETGTDQNETQSERRFIIQDDEAPAENEVQTSPPRTLIQTVENFLKRAFGSCFKGIFGAPKEN